jgi:hypothetical protein
MTTSGKAAFCFPFTFLRPGETAHQDFKHGLAASNCAEVR